MELWVGALNLGFLYAFMTMGVFITSRIFDFPDVTVDGSFTTGGAIAAVLIASGWNPAVALIAAFVLGAIAGSLTAIIHTRLNINGLLAGILVMTALYSVNLHIMGRSNIPLLHQTTFFTALENFNPNLPDEIWFCLSLLFLSIGWWLLASLFFKTDLGVAMRATGNNAVMASASGVNVNLMKIFGVALANGFVGVSGGMVAQYQGFADINMGIGTIVIGMASVIVGESVIRFRSMYAKVGGVVIGSLLFRLMIAAALMVGMNPIDLKLLTAVFVLLTLITSKMVTVTPAAGGFLFRAVSWFSIPRVKYAAAGIAFALVVAGGFFHLMGKSGDSSKKIKIGIVQLNDHETMNLLRDSFLKEMQRLGYESGKNCTFYLENANGELPSANTIIDRFVQEKVDLVLPLSTHCTQAAMNKIKDKPIVFTMIANPFIIDAGKSDADHLPNVTGLYCRVPMDSLLATVRKIIPGPLKIGAIWDPAQANSVYNVEILKSAAASQPDVAFEGANVTNSSEVYQAAQSLVQKGINVFVLSTDNVVYSTFESIVKAAEVKHIPVFVNDVELLPNGALGAMGFEYALSGVESARIVDRILKGENPKDIPFQQFKQTTVGYNLDAAKELGLTIPPDLLAEAKILVEGGKITKGSLTVEGEPVSTPAATPAVAASPKKLAFFIFSEHPLVEQTEKGVMAVLKESGVMDKYSITIDRKSAQNEFPMAQSIAQEIVASKYDYLLTFTTPVLQVCAQINKTIPHVFGFVTDPYRAGVVKTPVDNNPNLTGVASCEPVESTIKLMREMFPQAKTIGYIWNPAEACSEVCTEKARVACKEHGFELMEVNVSNTNDCLDATKSLIARGVDLFYTAGDNTVTLAVGTMSDVLRGKKIPYFTNSFFDVESGAFLSLGVEYYETGKVIGQLLVRIINGEKTKDIPISNYTPETMYLNLGLAKEYGLQISDEMIKRAAKVKE